MKRLERLAMKPLAAAIALAVPNLVFGQLEEIVVTAERREQAELTTAISVEVFTPEQLALDKLQTVDDLQNNTPNLTVSYQGFTIQSVNIRGVGNSVGNPNIQPGVAVMQDGMIMGETVVIQQAFLDIDTIEVLRGPQGTFVGQASTGGAVAINSARPNFDGVNGWLEARLGDYQDSKLSGAVNIPLSDNIATRFAFSQEERESYFENAAISTFGIAWYETGAHPGDTENQNFRASLLWEPSDSFSFLARAEFNTVRAGGDAPYVPNPRTFINPNDPTGFGQSQYAAFSEPVLTGNPDPYSLAYDLRDNHMDAISNRYSLEISKVFDNGIEFRTRSGYQYNDLRTAEDSDATRATGNVFRIDVGPDNDYWNHEFNLISPEENRVRWLVGTSWYYRWTPVNVAIDNNLCGYNPDTGNVAPCPIRSPQFPRQAIRTDGITIQRHAGLYGQILVDLTDNLEFEFGARNSWDNNVADQRVFVGVYLPDPADGGPPLPPDGPPRGACSDPGAAETLPNPDTYLCINVPPTYFKFKEEEPTWKIGLNWSPSDEQFVYVFYTRGYKSGGADTGLRFENEVVDDYEIGYKATLLDGRMQIQTGIFYMDYTNMQQQGFLVRDTASGQFSDNNAIFNIGDSTIEGLEFEMNGQFGNLGLNFAFGYTSSDLGGITQVDQRFLPPTFSLGGGNWVPQCVAGETPVPDALGPGAPSCFDYANSIANTNLSSADNVFSPELSWNFSLDYRFELSNGAVLRPRISYTYSDIQYSTLFQRDNFYQIDERELTNFSVSYERDAWTGTFYCNNCTDEVFAATVTSGANSRFVYTSPRTVGVRFHYDF